MNESIQFAELVFTSKGRLQRLPFGKKLPVCDDALQWTADAERIKQSENKRHEQTDRDRINQSIVNRRSAPSESSRTALKLCFFEIRQSLRAIDEPQSFRIDQVITIFLNHLPMFLALTLLPLH